MDKEAIIDCSGLSCVGLATMLNKSIISVSDGAQVRVSHVECGGKSDVQAWLRFKGHQLVEILEGKGEFDFIFIKKGGKK